MSKKHYKIIINEELCKGCDICVELCPTNVFELSEQINTKGYYVPKPILIENCTGCKICDLICPEMAILLEQIIDNN